jgi:putative phage-type endonuclease
MSLIFHYNKDLPKVTPLKAQYLENQVQVLKNIHQPVQKSQEWYEMRNTMVSASDFGTVLGVNPYSGRNEVLKKKCGDSTFMTNAAMQWGNKYENVAVLVYERRNNVSVLEFGCIRHPFISFLGASPDGITLEGTMLEIKCPTSRKITGIPPEYYWCQVQGQLEVCELDRCDFLECSFKEYEANEYNNDVNSHEKGVIAELYDRSTKTFSYIYSPICIVGRELDLWKKNIRKTNEVNFSSFSYWYLVEVSCVPIYRNQEWFNVAKNELELFWNDVLKYRQLGYSALLENIQDQKDEKKEIKLEKKLNKEPKPKKISAKESSKKQKTINDFIVLNNVSDSPSSEDDFTDDLQFNSSTSMFIDDEDEHINVIPVKASPKVQPKKSLSMFID